MNFETPFSKASRQSIPETMRQFIPPDSPHNWSREPDRAGIFLNLARELGVDEGTPEGLDSMLKELDEQRRLLTIRREGLHNTTTQQSSEQANER
jgi:hypothetical protein